MGKKRGSFFLKKKYKNLINRRKFSIFGGNNKKFKEINGEIEDKMEGNR